MIAVGSCSLGELNGPVWVARAAELRRTTVPPLITLKVEKFACTNFRENKISRGLIFATEDLNYFAVTYFREFRE